MGISKVAVCGVVPVAGIVQVFAGIVRVLLAGAYRLYGGTIPVLARCSFVHSSKVVLVGPAQRQLFTDMAGGLFMCVFRVSPVFFSTFRG